MSALRRIALITLCVMTLVLCAFSFSSCDLLGIGQFDVTFNVDGEEYQVVRAKVNEVIELPENPTKEGYTFDGWYLDDGSWKKPFVEDTIISNYIFFNTSVYAKFNVVTYSITYNTLGGSHTNPTSYNVTDEISLSDAVNEGYEFVGWYLDPEYTEKIDTIPAGTIGDLTLYARYDIDDYLLKYEKILSVGESTDNGIASLGACAWDSFGNPLTVSAQLKSGEFKGGSTVVYEITMVDENGVVTVVDTTEIPVYDVNDIGFTYNPSIKVIKVTSTGEEFEPVATDSFGEACEISIEVLEGFTFAGGETVTLRIIATDKAGNYKVSEDLAGVKVYDTPSIVFDEEQLPVRDNSDLYNFFTGVDNFGVKTAIEIVPSAELVIGENVVFTVTATDVAGNSITEEHEFLIYDSSKLFVKLYVYDELWDIVTIDDNANYELPLYELSPEFTTAGWVDENNFRYTNPCGVGIVELTQSIKLYYCIIEAGYEGIFTVEDLYAMSPTANYLLFHDLDLAGEEWIPVGTEASPYSGKFNGQGHTISNFKITNSNQYIGLFGYFTGSVQNLNVVNFTVAATYDTYCYAGGIVGYSLRGLVNNCYASGSMIVSAPLVKIGGVVGYNELGSIFSSNAGVQVYGSAVYNCYIGGLLGDSYNGTIINSFATGEVKITPNCDTGYAGGLVGNNNQGIIVNCYATGNVTGTASSIAYVGGLAGNNNGSVTNCYATGNVTANTNHSTNVIISYAGGLLGTNFKGAISNCYSIGNVSSNANARYCSAYAGGLIGYDFDGIINNCFTVGNVSALSSYESTFGAGIIGYVDGSKINNSYRNAEQIFSITRGASTVYVATNSEGVEESVDNLKSEEWIKTNLWVENNGIWSFEGEYPTLLIHAVND